MIDLTAIEEAIRRHMEDQPYQATCAECGNPVELDVEVDRTLDLRIMVPVCKCQEEW